MFASILKANPYHDKNGRFARASGAASIDAKSLKPTAKVIGAIRKRLTEEEIAAIDSYDRAMAGKKTSAEEHRKNGQWSHERIQLHKEIVESFLKDHEKYLPKRGQKPTLVMLGGRGGSGKSKLTDGTLGVVDTSTHKVLDPDEIKKQLPGYNGANAGLYHEESSHVADLVISAMINKKMNFVNDITMRSKELAKDTMDWAEMHGYRLEGHYMHLPVEEAGYRAMKRGLKKDEPRYVPLDIIAGNTHNEANFRQLSDRFEKWTIHSNEVAKGVKPFLLERGEKK